MPLLAADRRKEMEQEMFHEADKAGAGPEVVQSTGQLRMRVRDEREHNPVRRRAWSTVLSCFIKVPWCQMSALSGPLLEK